MIGVNKVIPDVCKVGDCFERADYEFTDLSDDGNLTISASGDDGNHMFVEQSTVTIGYACNNHVEEVNKMLMKIYAK
jgi:hypothetical protein